MVNGEWRMVGVGVGVGEDFSTRCFAVSMRCVFCVRLPSEAVNCIVVSPVFFQRQPDANAFRLMSWTGHFPARTCLSPPSCLFFRQQSVTTVCNLSGAIGFDWVTASQGGVSRLISWPRKKLITK